MDAGTTLRRARTEQALTLRDLATQAGTSHSTLAAYESGHKVPSVATFWRVLRAAGVDLQPALTWRAPTDSRRGEELEAVLRLASQFPARHERTLTLPRFPRPSVTDPS